MNPPAHAGRSLEKRLRPALALASLFVFALFGHTSKARAGQEQKPDASSLKADRPAVRPGIWTSAAELATLATSGPAWLQLKAVADADLGTANISDQKSDHDVKTLAVALVYARLGGDFYRQKAAKAIGAAIGTESGGRTLALGRNLAAYVFAADLIDLRNYDATLDRLFRDWLAEVIRKKLDGKSLIDTHEERPNNWGTHAGAARIAADLYLNDAEDLRRAAKVFQGWLGDRSAYAGFDYGHLSWQADPKKPVGINPPGASRDGRSIDGAIPDDMRRGGSFQWPPRHTVYPWGAMEGALIQAELLHRAGCDAWNWSDKAMLRASRFLFDLDHEFGDWWSVGDDAWMPWLFNRAYETNYPAKSPARPGKSMGWTDWTHSAR